MTRRIGGSEPSNGEASGATEAKRDAHPLLGICPAARGVFDDRPGDRTTYTLRVVAANASGASQPSNAVTLTFPGGCSGAPETLVNLQAWKVGSTIFVSWSPPVSGTAVESYVVSVTGAYVGNIATTGRALSSAAGPRAYAISAAAKNSCGAGPATAAQTVVIP